MKSNFLQITAFVCVFGLLTCAGVTAQNTGTVRGARTASSASVSDSQTVKQARTLLAAGKRDAALELLTTRARFAPNDYAVRQLLGATYYQKNDFPRTIQHLSAAVENLPPNSSERRQAIQMLALSHYALGHFKDAIPFLEQVQRDAPDNTEVAYALGNSYVITHDANKARASYARMFQVAPDSAAAYLINAQMMIRQQFEEVAATELKRAAELDPKLPQVNFMLGEMAIYQAKIDEGIAFLNKEIRLNPANGMAYYRLGEALTRQLKWTEAIAPLQKALLLNPTFSGSYIVLGKVYLKQNNLDNAEAMLRRATQMDPNNFLAHHLLAQVLQQANRTDEARKEFEIAERLRGTAQTK
ncbi:MAG: tetratricopeptide repeat protein [Pyrinomonadaceae bacterium MAG19_C2-C3]|nr:tetratricopeptide repeat protein [Pyrinomonadaceae bacterium MAG19_C2-C3]